MSDQIRSEHILAEQIDLLYRQSRAGLVVTGINSLILFVALMSVVHSTWLGAWLALVVMVIIGRYGLYHLYQRRSEASASPVVWSYRFQIGVAAAGICWGIVGGLLFPVDSSPHQMLLLIVIAGMTAGALPYLSSVWSAYLVFLIPSVIPLSLRLLALDNPVFHYVALMVLVFILAMIAASRQLNRSIRESLLLRFANSDLVDSLSQSKQELEHRNLDLQEEITERQKTEQKLKANTEFLERVMDSTSNAIYVADTQGILKQVNRAAMDISGYTAEELVDQHFRKLFPSDRHVELGKFFEQTAKLGRTVAHYEEEIIRKDGSARLLSFTNAPLRENGVIIGVVGSAEDITERKATDLLKDQFIATVNHELRTPLTSIQSAVELLLSDPGIVASPEATHLAKLAGNNSARLLRLINELLDIQQLESGTMRFRFSVYDADELVNKTLSECEWMKKRFGVKFVVSRGAGGQKIRVDRDRFVQALTSIFSNAAKHTREGDEIEIFFATIDHSLRVGVSDNGPGIPDHLREHVFDRFRHGDSSKHSGVGLGLTIAREIITRMGGRIDYESRDGQGATFFIDIPLSVE
jgi:PAS domain S-box-containing protein